jgi:flagellar basal body-associated protein FliL
MLRNHHQQTHRRGVILLVVILMLALFTIIGLAFLLYSESEATASRIFREARYNRIGDPTIPDDGPIDSFLDAERQHGPGRHHLRCDG